MYVGIFDVKKFVYYIIKYYCKCCIVMGIWGISVVYDVLIDLNIYCEFFEGG